MEAADDRFKSEQGYTQGSTTAAPDKKEDIHRFVDQKIPQEKVLAQ